MFLQELLGLLLMLQLNLLFFGGIRLLLRELGVFLLLLLLDGLAFLQLLGVELILLLLVFRVQLGVRGWRNNGARRRWNLVGMDCRSSSRPTGRGWLRSVVPLGLTGRSTGAVGWAIIWLHGVRRQRLWFN